MKFFKSKKQVQKEADQDFAETLEARGLDTLDERDKALVRHIEDNLEAATGYLIRGTEAEIMQADLKMVLIEQNWLMIKKLHEISQKLNK